MRLTELEPQFLSFKPGDAEGSRAEYRHVDSIKEAAAITFVCPECFRQNGNKRPGVHSIKCNSPAVPQGKWLVGPGRWALTGTGYDDLTLVAGSSSVRLSGPCYAHFHIRKGEISFCDDSGRKPK